MYFTFGGVPMHFDHLFCLVVTRCMVFPTFSIIQRVLLACVIVFVIVQMFVRLPLVKVVLPIGVLVLGDSQGSSMVSILRILRYDVCSLMYQV